MYAVLVSGGKQYRVEQGDVIYVEKLGVEDGTNVTFDQVLAVGDESGLKVGTPYVEGATVVGTAVKSAKGKKVVIFTYKPKKDSKRKMGHRQPYTKVQIDSINA